MLQQTRVETVVPYFERFMARFPSLRALALADPDEVRTLWSGLGYYRRAQLMHRAAQIVAERHGGELPGDPATLGELPGFGPYTVGAVASLAFDAPVPAVDGNVERVLARFHGIDDPRSAEGRRGIRAQAQAWVESEAPGEINEALIELGATVCSLRRPRCLTCPLQQACAARLAGRQEEIPPPRTRKPPKRMELAATLFVREGRVLFVQQPPGGLFAHLWTPPLGPPRGGEPVARVRHLLTHRELTVEVWAGDEPPSEGRWVAPSELESLAVPSLVLKILKAGLPKAMQEDLRWSGRKFAQKGPSGA